MLAAQQTRLSPRQKAIMRFIETHLSEKGYAPNIREIGQATRIPSTSVVNYNLDKLVERGYLERDARVSRGLRIVQLPGKRAKPRFQATPTKLTIEVPLTGDRGSVLSSLREMVQQFQGFTEAFAQNQP